WSWRQDGHVWPPEGLVLDGSEHDGIVMRAGSGRQLTLIIDRREIADRGMAAPAIVEAFHEGKYRGARRGLVPEALPIEQLAFQRGEEALAHGVVVGVADRAHRGPHACGPAALPELDRGVLRALIGVMDNTVGASRSERHLECIQHQPGKELGAHRPTDNASAAG